MAIPVIDFSKLDGPERAETMALIANGCEEWGFFQLVNHGLPEELLERVKKVCSECFQKEREQIFKDSQPVHMLNQLLQRRKNTDNHDESWRLENVDWEDVFTLQDDNEEWPSQLPEFREILKEYRRELKKLGLKVMEAMDENLGLEKGYINRAFGGEDGGDGQPFFGTKVSHYPTCPHPDRAIGLRAHTDAGGVILLFQDDKVGGLQILKDGQWIDVQPLPNAIVVNTGDQIEVLSNGRYKSVWHRVLATRDGNRRSIASFYNPSVKATIQPAPQLINTSKADQGDAKTYPKFVFGDYMSVYVKQKFQPKEPRFQDVASM